MDVNSRRIAELSERVAFAFRFTSFRQKKRWTENPRCRDFYFKGFCNCNPDGSSHLDHSTRSNEFYERFQVDVRHSTASGDMGIVLEVYYNFATMLILERLGNNIRFTTEQFTSLVSYLALLIETVKTEANKCKPITAIYLTFLWRFVRELFPITMKFLNHNHMDISPLVVQRMQSSINRMKADIEQLSSEWNTTETLRKNKLEMCLTQFPTVKDTFLAQLDECINSYCEEQMATSATRSLLHKEIVDSLSIILGDTLDQEFGGQTGYILEIFGSAANTFGSSSSDVDISITLTTKDKSIRKIFLHEMKIHHILLQLHNTILSSGQDIFSIAEFVSDARVPILKLIHVPSKTLVDLCWDNNNAMLNTSLLRDYANYDPRVRPLVMAIKLWASRRGVNSAKGGTLTSYGWILLVIHYLQCGCYPPVLPSLQLQQRLQQQSSDSSATATATSSSNSNSNNSASVGQLFMDFFRYYGIGTEYKDCTVGSKSHKCVSTGPHGEAHYSHHDVFLHVSDIYDSCCYAKGCVLGDVKYFSEKYKKNERKERRNRQKVANDTEEVEVDSNNDEEEEENNNDDEHLKAAASSTDVAIVSTVNVVEATVDNTEENIDIVDISVDVAVVDTEVDNSNNNLISDSVENFHHPHCPIPAASNSKHHWRLCIQDPFEEVDLGRVIWHPIGMKHIFSEIRRIGDIIVSFVDTISESSKTVETLEKAISNLSVSDSSSLSLFDQFTSKYDSPPVVPFYCLLCGSDDHGTRSCPSAECGVCFRTGHQSYECPRVTCKRCKRKGHFDRNCPGLVLGSVTPDSKADTRHQSGSKSAASHSTSQRRQKHEPSTPKTPMTPITPMTPLTPASEVKSSGAKRKPDSHTSTPHNSKSHSQFIISPAGSGSVNANARSHTTPSSNNSKSQFTTPNASGAMESSAEAGAGARSARKGDHPNSNHNPRTHQQHHTSKGRGHHAATTKPGKEDK